MAFIGFKTSKPRQFNYKPLFYSKQEDEFEQKLKKVREGSEDTGNGDLRQKMEQSWKRRRNSSSSRNSSIRKLAIAIALVFLLLYLIFFL